MRITLDQNEIERAIIAFVGNQGISITGKHVDVTLVAGRAPNGMSASIDISNDDEGHTGCCKTIVDVTDEKPKDAPGLMFTQPVEIEPVAVVEEENTAAEEKPLFGKS